MSKRSSLHMLLAILTAVAASVAMLIGGFDSSTDKAIAMQAGSETTQGKATP